MARPREFNRDEALQKAIEVFWAHGYEATSMSDLQRALGIGRQSLYNTFGDKQQIFSEALESYVSKTEAAFAESFPEDCGIEHVRAHFSRAALQLTQGEPRLGCMIMNNAIERAPHCAPTAAQVERGLATLRACFARAVTNARDHGDLDAGIDVEAVAIALTVHNAGLTVLARSGASVVQLQRSTDATLEALLDLREAGSR